MIARVQPLTRTRAVRGPFDYRLREDQAGVRVGSLLRVPFGGARALGVVVELASRSELSPDRLAEPEAVLPHGIPPDLVALAEWMAAEYCSTPARALSLVLAPGAAAGMRVKRALVAELTPAGRHALGAEVQLTERQRGLLASLDSGGPAIAAGLGTAALRRLEARGLVALNACAQPRRPKRHELGRAPAVPPPLTSEQRHALEAVLDALAARRGPDHGGRFLLHGVTGSGKTEVYLRAVQATLAAGRGAIVLVPEIALTPQALTRFQARLGDVIAVMHSGMSRGERHEQWTALARGQAHVCVGARSAVFAPLAEIGLIVVDEEHEASYKHEGDPRYDARAVAERRAHDHDAVLLLGSATPRPESAMLPRLRLRSRIDGRPLPPVEILDMRGHHHPLHPLTRSALVDTKRAGGKAIVLLNRRGWSNFLSCRACGHVWMCPNCEVALVLHRGAGSIDCHHCGHRQRVPSHCVVCSSVAVARHGAGTERIERELADALHDERFPVLRLDADSVGFGARARTLQRFEASPAGVLVGTQMVAKGHDFPDVALGVVIDADQTLRFPDFRSEERTFALVTQLAGRTGRSVGVPGAGGRETAGDRQSAGAQATAGAQGAPRAAARVLVQTLTPTARSILLAAQHDADGFLAGELERRQALAYPPFATLIRVVCSAPDAAGALALAATLKHRIAPPGATVLGPAPLFALRGRARAQLVVKAGDRAAAIEAVGAAVDSLARSRRRRDTSVSVDVDPQ